ncbi:MAG: helix-turn-helix domain-containing protein [Nitriliruptoraceae bacterium]
MAESGATPAGEPIRWVSTRDAAQKLGITTRTLYRLIDDGQVPAHKFGRVIRLKDSDIDAFIDGARIEPGSLSHLYANGPDDEAAE